MAKILIVFEDGTSKEVKNVNKIKISNHGIGYCLPVEVWHDAYMRRLEIQDKKENVELQEVVESLPTWNYYKIKYTPGDATYDGYYESSFVVEFGAKSADVESNDIVDALKKLVELENE